MARGPQRRGAQCSCICCIGLRPALHTGTINMTVKAKIACATVL